MRITSSILILLALAGSAMGQANSIVASPHNLSAAGPGAIRANAEQEICIFCHTPHNASPIQPLWNRNTPVGAYVVYASNSLDATPGQPTGSSKLCLSCHDGSIAVGSVLSRGQSIGMAGGVTTLPQGTANLGTDLSDDHPISFRYDAGLAARDPKIKSPSLLPEHVKLDARGEMQCTSCHDAHDNSNGKFLVMDNTASQLCNSCHQISQTSIPEHINCASCHQQHSAPSGAKLLRGATANETCATCHGGQPGPDQGANIMADLNKISRHGDPNPTPAPMVRLRVAEKDPTAVNCADCHEPHTMNSGFASAPSISPKLGSIDGVNGAGAQVTRAQFGYEVCFKCHDNQNVLQPKVSRQIAQNNTRLQFAPSSVSFHPVEVAGKNSDVPSLRPGLTTANMVACTDCHASESSKDAGSSGPNGPHGSNISPLLLSGYDMIDGTTESAAAYALCYRCHDRSSILTDQSFVGHKSHIVNERVPCSICHDSHGISSAQGNSINNSKLMNFDISVVQPDPVTGRLEYRSTGPRMGECFLSCHGVAHSPKTYPVNVEPEPVPTTVAPGPSSPVREPKPGLLPVSPIKPNPTRNPTRTPAPVKPPTTRPAPSPVKPPTTKPTPTTRPIRVPTTRPTRIPTTKPIAIPPTTRPVRQPPTTRPIALPATRPIRQPTTKPSPVQPPVTTRPVQLPPPPTTTKPVVPATSMPTTTQPPSTAAPVSTPDPTPPPPPPPTTQPSGATEPGGPTDGRSIKSGPAQTSSAP